MVTTHNEWLDVYVIDTWDGLRDRTLIDQQDDIAIVTRINGNWLNTSASDYMPIWAGSMSTVDINRVYGAGYPEGPIFGRLRSTPVNIYGSKKYFFWDLAGGRRVCDGDSGGPYLDMVPDNQAQGGYREVVIGLVSSSEGGHPCTSAGGEQYASRLAYRIDWLRQHMNRFCTTRASIAFCNMG